MDKARLLFWSVVGTIVTAICCFTPVLVIVLSAIGLAALVPVLDLFLLPLLGFFLILTAYAFWQNRRLG